MNHAATSEGRRRLAALVIVLGALALVLSGCTGRDQAGRGHTATANDGARAYFHTGYGEEPPIQVEVRLVDGRVEMPPSLPSGLVTFVISNDGDRPHCFGIEGPGIHRTLDADLAPGQSGELSVRLTAGTYRVRCPLDHHGPAATDRWLRVAS